MVKEGISMHDYIHMLMYMVVDPKPLGVGGGGRDIVRELGPLPGNTLLNKS